MAVVDRVRVPELMDDPALDPGQHFAALHALARINALSGTVRTLAVPLFRFARQAHRGRLRVLDVATGGGDVPIGLWRSARRHGLELEILAVDAHPGALEFAQARAAACGAAVEFSELDVLADALPGGFDVVTCCLFLHHLDAPQVVSLLRSMARAADHLVLVSDLARSQLGLALAYVATWVLTFSAVARVDGARSARAAFSLEEIRQLAEEAGLSESILQRHWPSRYLLSWSRG